MKLNLLAVESLILFCTELKEIISEIGTKNWKIRLSNPLLQVKDYGRGLLICSPPTTRHKKSKIVFQNIFEKVV